MASHPENCEICAQIELIQRGEHHRLIAELATGYAVLGENQYFRGYTLFLCKQPAPDLEDLSHDFKIKFLEEMALVSEAVAKAVRPHKMNVESLGNVVPHLHWHLFPRQLSENEPLKPVWLVMPQGDEANGYKYDAERDGELVEKLKIEILRLKPKVQNC